MRVKTPMVHEQETTVILFKACIDEFLKQSFSLVAAIMPFVQVRRSEEEEETVLLRRTSGRPNLPVVPFSKPSPYAFTMPGSPTSVPTRILKGLPGIGAFLNNTWIL